MLSFEDFLLHRKISSKDELNRLRKAYEILSEPYSIHSMITLIECGVTPMSAVISKIEQSIDCNSLLTRQNIGRLLTYVLHKYGYKPNGQRARLRTFSGTEYFTTGMLYTKDNTAQPEYKIIVLTEKNDY